MIGTLDAEALLWVPVDRVDGTGLPKSAGPGALGGGVEGNAGPAGGGQAGLAGAGEGGASATGSADRQGVLYARAPAMSGSGAKGPRSHEAAGRPKGAIVGGAQRAGTGDLKRRGGLSETDRRGLMASGAEAGLRASPDLGLQDVVEPGFVGDGAADAGDCASGGGRRRLRLRLGPNEGF